MSGSDYSDYSANYSSGPDNDDDDDEYVANMNDIESDDSVGSELFLDFDQNSDNETTQQENGLTDSSASGESAISDHEADNEGTNDVIFISDSDSDSDVNNYRDPNDTISSISSESDLDIYDNSTVFETDNGDDDDIVPNTPDQSDDDIEMLSADEAPSPESPIPFSDSDEDDIYQDGNGSASETYESDSPSDVSSEVWPSFIEDTYGPIPSLVPLTPATKPFLNGNTECPICLEAFADREPTATNCGHVFCRSCILGAIAVSSRCPVCRRHVNRNRIRPVTNLPSSSQSK